MYTVSMLQVRSLFCSTVRDLHAGNRAGQRWNISKLTLPLSVLHFEVRERERAWPYKVDLAIALNIRVER